MTKDQAYQIATVLACGRPMVDVVKTLKEYGIVLNSTQLRGLQLCCKDGYVLPGRFNAVCITEGWK